MSFAFRHVAAATAALLLASGVSAAPGPTITPGSLSLSSDSGRSNTDFVTRFASQTLSGVLSSALNPGDVLQVSVDNGATWTTATVSNGSTAWTLGATLMGSNTIIVRVVDSGGNAGPTLTQGYVVDTTAPPKPGAPVLAAASDTGDSSTDGITSVAQVTVTGTAEANAAVFLYDTDGTTVRGGTVADGAGNWSITSSTLAQGSHTLTVRAEDVAGNASVFSNSLTVVVDTAGPGAPSIPVLDPASDSGVSNSDRITAVNTPTFTGTGGEANAVIQVYDSNNLLLASGRADGAGNWIVTAATPLADALYSIRARSVDVAGNAGTFSGSRLIQIDTAAPNAPTLRLTAGSDSGISSNDGITSTAALVFSGTTEANAVVTLYNGATAIGTTTSGSGGAWSITPSAALAEGSYTLTARATDRAGNTGSAASVSVTIDRTAPPAPAGLALAAGSDTGSSATDGITSVATPTVTGSTEAGATVTLYDTNGTTVLGSAVANGSGGWSITSSTLSAGAHTLTAKARDTAGNTSTASGGLVVTVDTAAPATPAAPRLATASDTGTIGDGITEVRTPVISGTAETFSAVTLYDSDGIAALGTTFASTTGDWSITSSTLAIGQHSLTVKAVDAAGNVSGASPALQLMIADSAPAAPALTSAIPGDGEVTLSWNAPADNGSTISSYTVAGSPAGTCVSGSSTVLTCKVTGLTNGTTYSFTVKALSSTGPGIASLPLSATPVRTAASGSVPGNIEPATATISGGAQTCTLTSTNFSAAVPAGLPVGVTLPVGTFAFTTKGCPNDRLTVSVQYPTALPANVRFMKFGPQANESGSTWFELASSEITLSSDRKTVTYQITDNQRGDSNPAVGLIDDPFAPVVIAAAAPGGATPVPTLSQLSLFMLGLLMAVFCMRRLKGGRP